jgi:flagellar export protein FliJ
LKKFKFKLEKVLVHRQILADLAQKSFADAQALLAKETADLNAMVEARTAALEQRTKSVETTTDWANSVAQINQYVTGQDLRIKNQTEVITKIENLVEARREILREAVSEVKILERLEEKQKLAYMAEAAKVEQAELDELSVIRFSRIESLIKGSHEDGI